MNERFTSVMYPGNSDYSHEAQSNFDVFLIRFPMTSQIGNMVTPAKSQSMLMYVRWNYWRNYEKTNNLSKYGSCDAQRGMIIWLTYFLCPLVDKIRRKFSLKNKLDNLTYRLYQTYLNLMILVPLVE